VANREREREQKKKTEHPSLPQSITNHTEVEGKRIEEGRDEHTAFL
jgi:hypothetical protein